MWSSWAQKSERRMGKIIKQRHVFKKRAKFKLKWSIRAAAPSCFCFILLVYWTNWSCLLLYCLVPWFQPICLYSRVLLPAQQSVELTSAGGSVSPTEWKRGEKVVVGNSEWEHSKAVANVVMVNVCVFTVYHRPNTTKYLSVYKCGNRVYPRSKVHFWQDNLSCTLIAAFLCQTQVDLNV